MHVLMLDVLSPPRAGEPKAGGVPPAEGALGLRAVLFDLDGVLVDTARFHFLAWKRLADRLDIPFDQEANEQLKGVSRAASLEILLAAGARTFVAGEKAALADEKNAVYLEMVRELTPADVLPGVLPFLRELREHSIKTAVCSASQSAGRIIELLELQPYFDAVLGGHDVARGKPEPDIFLAARDRLGCESGECLVVEDAVAGVQAGLAAGMKVAGIGKPGVLGEADRVFPDMTMLTLAAVSPLFFS